MISLSKVVTTALQRPIKFFGLIFIAFAFFSLAGGPLALFQMVAWGKMIRNYSAQESVSTAFQKTFSGKYPCPLCQKITAEKKKEKQSQNLFETITKKEKVILEKTVLLTQPSFKKVAYPEVADSHYHSFMTGPATPPPRA